MFFCSSPHPCSSLLRCFTPPRDDASGIWKPAPVSDLFLRDSPKLIDIDAEDCVAEPPERLDIDLYGQRFRTDLDCSTLEDVTPPAQDIKPKKPEERQDTAVPNHSDLKEPSPPHTPPSQPYSTLLSDGAVKDFPKPEEPKESKKSKIRSRQLQRTPQSPRSPTVQDLRRSELLDCIDAAIFAGLDDTSMLDNIVKSFSEDDFSCVEAPMTSDSGLYSSDETRGHSRPIPCLPSLDNSPEKVELRTLQQIFDRSFSSNLSSPHESTSFDDDIFSTEHSDEKNGNYLDDFRSKMNDMKSAYNPKKIQKFYPKNMDDFMKKPKRGGQEPQKRTKSLRKKEGKTEKRRGGREEEEVGGRKPSLKVADRFEENLLEYSVKDADVDDALEATRKLSLQYGLRLPDARPEPSSPDRAIKVIEGHFKATLPTSDREKPKAFRSTRYDSFGDPDFGTPV